MSKREKEKPVDGSNGMELLAVSREADGAAERGKKKRKKRKKREKRKREKRKRETSEAGADFEKAERKRARLREEYTRDLARLNEALERARRELSLARMPAILETESGSAPASSALGPRAGEADGERVDYADEEIRAVRPIRSWWWPWRKPEMDPRTKAILGPMWRRPPITDKKVFLEPVMARRMKFSAGIVQASVRLLTWLFVLGFCVLGSLLDRLRPSLRTNGPKRRTAGAKRLVAAIKRMGGTAVKIGQQAAIRRDMLPDEYITELDDMFDKVQSFAPEEAIEAVERALKRPLYEVFTVFDSIKPIGSASVACVYQAQLKDGTKVAVKVRRPGIGKKFAADMRALRWLFQMVEWSTLIPPGMMKNFVKEFDDMLMGELDFRIEARNAEIFEAEILKAKMSYASAPKVFFEYSTDEVLITELIEDGIKLAEVLAVVESDDPKGLAELAERNISPKRVARRLLDLHRFNAFENLLFHADPHPANIFVRPNNAIVLIDFGACGSYTEKERRVWAQLLEAQRNNDVGQMVQCAIALIEPLPPIDVEQFTKEMETVFWQDLFAFKSVHSPWNERTSARIWFSFLEKSGQYNIPMNLNTLRMIRATLLYDTIAARLYNKIDAYDEYHRYTEKAGKRAHKRVRKQVHRAVTGHWPARTWVRVEKMFSVANSALYHVTRLLDNSPFNFISSLTKGVYTVMCLFRGFLWAVTPSLLYVPFFWVRWHFWYKFHVGDQNYLDYLKATHGFEPCFENSWMHDSKLAETLCMMGKNSYYEVWIALVSFYYLRAIHYRLSEKNTA